MSDSVQETKEMFRTNEQKSSSQEFNSNLPSFIPSAPAQSRPSSASASESTPTVQATHETILFLPNYKFPIASTAHELLQSRCKSNLAKGVRLPLKTMTYEETR